MGFDPFTAALIGSAVVGLFGAKKQADAAKDAARKQARAIEEANRKAAERDVTGKALKSDVEDEAEVTIGSTSARSKKRKSRIELSKQVTAGSSSVGGL